MSSYTSGHVFPTSYHEQGENVSPFSLQQPFHNSRQIHNVLGCLQISQAFDGFLSYTVSMSYAKKPFLLSSFYCFFGRKAALFPCKCDAFGLQKHDSRLPKWYILQR